MHRSKQVTEKEERREVIDYLCTENDGPHGDAQRRSTACPGCRVYGFGREKLTFSARIPYVGVNSDLITGMTLYPGLTV